MIMAARSGRKQRRQNGRRQIRGRWAVPFLLTILAIGLVWLSAPAPALAPSSSWSDLAQDNTSPADLWSDGDTMWVADYWDQYVYAYDLETGDRELAHDIDVADEGVYPTGLWGDEQTL